MSIYNYRWQELDWIRGIAVIGMILVISPGHWSYRFEQLNHAAWNGFTFADLVMPLFLFSVGVSISLSSPLRTDFSHPVKRFLILIGLGLIINILPEFQLDKLRLPGVLQRIALTYLVGIIVWRMYGGSIRSLIYVSCIILIINFISANVLLPLGAQDSGTTPYSNWGAIIDRAVFGVDHLWAYGTMQGKGVVYDPDGLLSSLFASVNVLVGIASGKLLSPLNKQRPVLGVFGFGGFLIAVALLFNFQDPINKPIWTVSFTLLTGGLSMQIFATLIFMRKSYPSMTLSVLSVFGSNAMTAYLIASLMLAYSGYPILETVTAQNFLFETFQNLVANPWVASLLCTLSVTTLIFILVNVLFRKQIFLSI